MNAALVRRAVLIGCALGSVAAVPPDPKRVRAVPKGEASITLDGRLDEPVWKTAPIASDFVERTPYPKRKPPVRTEFRVLFDEGTVYVGVVSYTGGVPPRGRERARDSFEVFADDAISLKFDVRLDRRTTVGFVTNPAGVQLDYVAVENGGDFRREFDAIWDVETSVTDDAWVAEFAIPVVALGLPSGEDINRIGLQISRDHNARLATYDWSEMPPEFGPTAALYYGRVDDLKGLSGGNPLTILPYALGSLDYDPRRAAVDDDLDYKFGGDLRARFGQDIWTELTILTDFAQVDLDNPVVNTNRFPLFFPERRPFFLSGLEVFDFGASEFSQIFFSRRIGLDDSGNTVPLLAGLKSYGSVGDFRFGLLQVLTDEDGDEPARSFSVARVRQNFGERGHLGLMATLEGRVPPLSSGDPPFEPNLSVGGDGAFRALGRRLELTGFLAGTINHEGDLERGTSGQASVAWRGENLQPSVAVSFVSERFNPTIGFVARRNLLQTRLNLLAIFRPEGSGIQELSFSVRGLIEQQLSDGETLGQRADGEVYVRFRNGLEAGVVVAKTEDTVREGFTLLNQVPVAPDRYFGESLVVYAGRTSQRNPYFDVSYTRDTSLFGGLIQTIDGFAGVNLLGYMRAEVGAGHSWVDFDGRDTIETTTVNAKVSATPTTKLVIDFIGQSNSVEGRLTGLVRLRWRYLPGSDLFLVYRENVACSGFFLCGDDDPDVSRDEVEPFRSVTLKLNYRFDALL